VTLDALDRYPQQVLRVLLALKQLEEVQLLATYHGLSYKLGDRSKPAELVSVKQAVRRARKAGLVEAVETSSGGKGHKAVFALTDKGREVLRG